MSVVSVSVDIYPYPRESCSIETFELKLILRVPVLQDYPWMHVTLWLPLLLLRSSIVKYHVFKRLNSLNLKILKN